MFFSLSGSILGGMMYWQCGRVCEKAGSEKMLASNSCTN